ncbi:hypothetical protein [Clostridium gasigenes]|uniref:hypothetical protein n=1 Tax=Clostridium gasigenes TaxID=94869 RepID=UPI001C0DD339|nr:hypothetical protein [Clostridium gasigenes]MBU3107596.1 hypothetical protein [Clostridium gasigenes]
MADKIKALPHKITFAIGLSLVLVGITISNILPLGICSMLVSGIPMFIGTIFILIASDKRHSNIDK